MLPPTPTRLRSREYGPCSVRERERGRRRKAHIEFTASTKTAADSGGPLPPALVRGTVGRGGCAATHAGGRAQCVVRSWAPSPIRKNSLQQHHPVRWLIIEKLGISARQPAQQPTLPFAGGGNSLAAISSIKMENAKKRCHAQCRQTQLHAHAHIHVPGACDLRGIDPRHRSHESM